MMSNESLEKLVNSYTADLVDEPLEYEEVEFEYDEWDNIPVILTKMCLNLNKYMKSTINYLENKNIMKIQNEVKTLIYKSQVTENNFEQLKLDNISFVNLLKQKR
jgi:hypothetical protein